MHSTRVILSLTAVLIPAFSGACGSEPKSSTSPDRCDEALWYRDVDGDGHGDAAGPYEACEAPAGHVADALDCDDQDPDVSPAAVEVCNGRDDNCDGQVDEGVDGGEAIFYADADGDGYGDADVVMTGCSVPTGYVDNDQDCDDTDPLVSPDGEDEPRDGVDGDCDGVDATSLAERAHVGDVNLLSAEDISAFCEAHDGVIGNLQVAGPDVPVDVELDCLVEVTGDVVVSADSLVTLSLGALWWVGGEARLAGNPVMSEVQLPALRFVDGGLVLIDNPELGVPTFSALEAVGELTNVDGGDFPVLQQVGGNLSLADGMVLNRLDTVLGGVSVRDASLTDVALVSLRHAGAVDLQSVAVRSLMLDALEGVDSLELDLPALSTPLVLPALTTVSRGLRIVSGPSQVEAPLLETVGGDLSLDPAGVQTIDVRALVSVEGALHAGGAGLEGIRAESLEAVGGELWLTCPGCDGVNLDALQRVAGDLRLEMGPPLENLSLSNLETIEGGMEIVDAHRLRELSMPSLQTLGGDATVSELEELEYIDWSQLVDPSGTLSVVILPALDRLDLSSLTLGVLTGHLLVRDNPGLTTLSLGTLGSELGSFTLQNCPGIFELDLSSLTTIGELHIAGPFASVDLSGLESTTGSVTMALDAVPQLELGSLERVGGDLELSGELQSFDLSALEVVGGHVVVNASQLVSLDFPMLREVFTDMTLEINGAERLVLTSLEAIGGSAVFLRAQRLGALALPVLDAVGTLTFSELASVETISVPSLTATTGSLEILDCDLVEDLDGFSSVTTVGASLSIAENGSLTDLAGLSSITSVGGNVRIENNPLLSSADAESLVEGSIGEGNIGGGVLIAGNAP